MKKKDIHKYRKSYLIFCIAISIICPCGIPFIPIGFIMGGPVWLVAAIVGIILAAFGFYGIPLFWVGYASVSMRARVYDAITLDNLDSVTSIMRQLQSKHDDIYHAINWLLAKRYLTGYLFDGEYLNGNRRVVQEQTPLKKELHWEGTCPHCGGTKATERDGKLYCDYCGADVTSPETSGNRIKIKIVR